MKKIRVLFALLFISLLTNAQQLPFFADIQQFKELDKLQPPPKKAILFVGSSSFTMWKDVADYFPGYTLINRGFGGSSLPDLLRYEQDIIFPYQPKQVVIYCGENDFAASDTVSTEVVVTRFTRLFTDIRQQLPGASIAFVSIKPSPSRRHLQAKIIAANARIQSFLAMQRNAVFINIYDKMLEPDGRMMGALFLSDSLHMNAKGYAIWQKAIQPHLLH
ncbi:GDSL-type esterase/lipase family protein [Flavihumibacter fluvii]|uniref:GDSL-type esterase/lipase family protein n=1 Tax=Flavihumibacter fluvii TaxID=2838157 RepID=UPI001BDF2142|nr:GDSL-type esterase/lipase family protein [Flavihumibacter fluvii]ULQ52210.1 GDSL-type esterase/lipase family protein [Flavihumibacter fluvii]